MKQRKVKPKTSKQIAHMIRTGKGVTAAIRRAVKKAIAR